MAQQYAQESGHLGDLPPVDVIFGQSSRMALARSTLERVAATDLPVLLLGECGTGKDVCARLLHARSGRANSAWVKVICPAIPNTLIESELFGYEKGAFTGAYTSKRGRVEQAHRGTLFLDEVGSLDSSAQAKLLQLLQDGSFMGVGAQQSRKIDARIVCAANASLRKQVEEGSSRLDLFFRVNTVTIDLPPLRQRIDDLPMLTDYLLEVNARALHRVAKPLSHATMLLMRRYNWPGNIRQLENMIRSYLLIGSEEALGSELVPAAAEWAPEIDLANPVSLKEITRNATRDLERQIILKVLTANGWSRRKTAKWLKISYRSLLYKLQGTNLVGPGSHAPQQSAERAMAGHPLDSAAPEKAERV